MAKGKKSSGKHYTSKGERPNVSAKIRNALRRDRRARPNVDDMIRSWSARQEIISKPRGEKQRELRERYIAQEDVQYQAHKLYDQYRDAGITWAACVQAVKTNFVEYLHNKWSPRIKAVRGTAD